MENAIVIRLSPLAAQNIATDFLDHTKKETEIDDGTYSRLKEAFKEAFCTIYMTNHNAIKHFTLLPEEEARKKMEELEETRSAC